MQSNCGDHWGGGMEMEKLSLMCLDKLKTFPAFLVYEACTPIETPFTLLLQCKSSFM